jgi:hypothetical protein
MTQRYIAITDASSETLISDVTRAQICGDSCVYRQRHFVLVNTQSRPAAGGAKYRLEQECPDRSQPFVARLCQRFRQWRVAANP